MHDLAGHVIESLRDGVIALGPDGRVVLANSSAAELLGTTRESLREQADWETRLGAVHPRPEIPPSDAAAQLGDVLASLRRIDGEARWVSVSFQPLREGAEVLGTVVALRDITLRRRFEERFERAFADAPIGMSIMAIDGRFLRVNRALCELLQYPPEELEKLRWPAIVHGADRHKAEQWLEEAPAAQQVMRSDELRYLARDGSVLYVVKTGSVVRDAAGDPKYFVCQFLDLSEQRRYEAELERRALHDHLTSLPNRALFNDRLRHALDRQPRTREAVGIVFLDLDEFKRVNDSLGHGVGDRVLVETARRLETVMRSGDTICRFGGDEFVVLCEDLDPETATKTTTELADRVLAAVAAGAYVIGEHELVLRGSVGIAIAGPDDHADAERLVAESDSAMYRAKRRGGGVAEMAADETRAATHRLQLEIDLRAALSGAPGLWLAYQPIVDLRDSTIVGIEALLRWDRPGRGPVSPVELIPIAEDAGLIVELGEWVLRNAVADFARWPGEGRPYLAINLGARQFTSHDLVHQIRASSDEHHVDPGRICLEITEGVAMADAEAALAIMRNLKDAGVQIAIDDFGTGFSSLGYLKRFPADTLKVDRVFTGEVARPSEDQAIVSAVLSLGASLGLEVIAEGVETEEQRLALTALGCRRAQGYLFARPGPLADVAQRSLH